MADWLQQYTAALEARNTREQAHKHYIDAYTRLADKTAAARQSAKSQDEPIATPVKGKAAVPASPNDISSLRADLVSTQKARATLATSLKDVETQLAHLQLERKQSSNQIAALTRSKTDLERRLRDRDEELRGKSAMAVQAQDEMVAMELQMTLAEERADKLSKENKELVERWMKRMGEEAEKVNRDSRWA